MCPYTTGATFLTHAPSEVFRNNGVLPGEHHFPEGKLSSQGSVKPKEETGRLPIVGEHIVLGEAKLGYFIL